MLRWAIGIILLGIFVSLFFGGAAGNQLVDVGKWVAGLAVFIWVVWIIISFLGGPRARTAAGPIDPL